MDKTFWRSFWGGFFGKVAATLFFATCAAFAIGPDALVNFMIEALPEWITPNVARAAFASLGLVTFGFMFGPPLYRFAFGQEKKMTDETSEQTKVELKINNKRDDDSGAANGELTIHMALYWIAQFSAWIRWQDALQIADNGEPMEEWIKMDRANFVFLQQAEKGGLKVRGRRHGQLEYEDISADFWKNTYLHLQKDTKTIWRATIKARHGLEEEAAAQVPNYVSLMVSEHDIERLWPKNDKDLDAETGRLS